MASCHAVATPGPPPAGASRASCPAIKRRTPLGNLRFLVLRMASCHAVATGPPPVGADTALRASRCGAMFLAVSVRGCPCPESRRMLTSAGRMPERRQHPSERRAGCPKRTSGDGAWAAPNRGAASRSRRSRSGLLWDSESSVRGCPCPESRRMLTSGARMAKRSQHPSERRAGCPKRTSGDGAWAAPNRGPPKPCPSWGCRGYLPLSPRGRQAFGESAAIHV